MDSVSFKFLGERGQGRTLLDQIRDEPFQKFGPFLCFRRLPYVGWRRRPCGLRRAVIVLEPAAIDADGQAQGDDDGRDRYALTLQGSFSRQTRGPGPSNAVPRCLRDAPGLGSVLLEHSKQFLGNCGVSGCPIGTGDIASVVLDQLAPSDRERRAPRDGGGRAGWSSLRQ